MISISEAAKYLKVSPMTLRRWEEDGILIPIERTKGGHRKYTKEQLDNYLEQHKPTTKIYKKLETEIYQAIQLLANGLIKLNQELIIKKSLELPNEWKSGTAFLFKYSQISESEKIFPLNLIDQLRWLKIPLNEWPLEGFDSLFRDEEDITGIKPIIYTQQNLEYAEILQSTHGDLELTSKFVEFMKECRQQKSFEEYTKARSFLIEYPVLDETLRSKSRSALYELSLETRTLISSFYEEIPAHKIGENGKLYLCEYCRFPLSIISKGDGKEYRCVYYKCKLYIEKQSKKKQKKYETILYKNQKQLKSEVLHAITLPGISELRLYNQLVQMSNITNVQLFPEGDVGDIAFEKDNETFLLDLKDYLNAHQLLTELNSKGVYRLSKKKYKHLWIVIPKFHSQKYVQYIKRKLHEDVVYKVIHENQLLKFCREEK